MLSQEVLNCKRKHEYILIDLLLQHKVVAYKNYLQELSRNNCSTDRAVIASVQRVLDLSFFTQANKDKYGERPIVVLDKEKNFKFNHSIRERLNENNFFWNMVIDILSCAKEKNKLYECHQPLTLYEKYSRKDVCKLLNWERDE